MHDQKRFWKLRNMLLKQLSLWEKKRKKKNRREEASRQRWCCALSDECVFVLSVFTQSASHLCVLSYRVLSNAPSFRLPPSCYLKVRLRSRLQTLTYSCSSLLPPFRLSVVTISSGNLSDSLCYIHSSRFCHSSNQLIALLTAFPSSVARMHNHIVRDETIPCAEDEYGLMNVGM